MATPTNVPKPNPALAATLAKLNTDPTAKAEAEALGVIFSESDTEVFHVFESSRPGIRFVTPTGFRISFSGNRYLTQNEDAMSYLRQCIKDGINTITEREPVQGIDIDNSPEKERKKYFLEFMTKRDELAKPNRDLGNTKAPGIKVATSAEVPK